MGRSTIHSEKNVKLSREATQKLVDALLKCRTVRDRETRDMIVAQLSFSAQIKRSDIDRNDVLNIVNVADDYGNGKDELLDIISDSEGYSIPVKNLGIIFQQFKYETPVERSTHKQKNISEITDLVDTSGAYEDDSIGIQELDSTFKHLKRQLKWAMIMICLLSVIALLTAALILSQRSNLASEPEDQDSPTLAPSMPTETSAVTNPILADQDTSPPTSTIICPNNNCGQNLLLNGGFEQNFEFWRGIENAEIVSGRTGQAVQINYDGPSPERNSDIFQRLLGTFEQGAWYWAEAWCKADIGEQCRLFIGDANHEFGPDYENSVFGVVDGNGEWQLFGASLYLSKIEQLDLFLYSQQRGRSIIYDNIRVEKVVCNHGRLCNGDFEKGTVTWNIGPGSQIISPGYESESALLSIQKRSVSDGPVWEGITQDLAVSPDLTYMLGSYIDAGDATEPHLKVLWFDSEESLLDVDKIIGEISAGGTWSRWEKWFKAPPSAALARVAVWHGVASEKNATGSTLRIDDLIFQPSNTLCPTDQLCNPSFEMDSLFGWSASGSIDSDAYHGQFSLKSIQIRLVDSSPSWAGASQDIEISADQDYDINVWLKWDAASEVHAKVV